MLAAYCAIAIPSFGKVIGLVGGVCCTAMVIFFPPLMLVRGGSLLTAQGKADAAGPGVPAKGLEVPFLYFVALLGLAIMKMSV